MAFNNEKYKIVYTNDVLKEMDNIYYYISEILCAPKAAKDIINKINSIIFNLKDLPKLYGIIMKFEDTELEYRRIVVKNYVVIYTIDERDNVIYIVHIIYGRNNYLTKYN